MKIEEIYPGKLPVAYLSFLSENPEGGEITFNEYKDEDPDDEGRYWQIMNQQTLLETWEMKGVGRAANYESLKLYVQLQREFGRGDFTPSNVGKIPLDRVAAGFVFGEENGDYVYLDAADGNSVWIYYHDGGDVLRIADSFSDFLETAP